MCCSRSINDKFTHVHVLFVSRITFFIAHFLICTPVEELQMYLSFLPLFEYFITDTVTSVTDIFSWNMLTFFIYRQKNVHTCTCFEDIWPVISMQYMNNTYMYETIAITTTITCTCMYRFRNWQYLLKEIQNWLLFCDCFTFTTHF